MRLGDYWDRFWRIQTDCLQPGKGFNWGRVDVGVSGALEVFLSGTPLVGANGLGSGTNLTMGNDDGVVSARENA